MRFRTLPIVAIGFIAIAMIIQFVISASLEKEHVREVVEYQMQSAQKDFLYELYDFHHSAEQMKQFVLDHPNQPQELLEETRLELTLFPDIDNVFVKFAPGVYTGKETNYFPRSYRSGGRIVTTAQGAEGLNYYARDWYTGALRCDSNGYWSAPYRGASTGTIIASHSMRVEDEQGQLIAVVGNDFRIEWIRDILEDIKPYNEAICIIYSTNGTIIAATDNISVEEEIRHKQDPMHWLVYSQTVMPIDMQLEIAVPNYIIWQGIKWRSTVTLCILIIGIVVLFLLFRRFVKNQKAYLQVENEHKLVQNEMHIAQNIQTDILAHDFIDDKQLALHATLIPMQSVGGDLYDFYRDGDSITFIIGDVSGKGMPAALFMAAAVTLFRAAVKHHSATNAIMEEMNSTLSSNNRSMMFVTAFIGRLHLPTGQLSFCNAGHLPPVLVKDGQCRMFDLPEANIPLGFDGTYRFSEQTITLDHGEQILVFTDGVSEAENTRKQQLGFDHLIDMLRVQTQPIDDLVVYDVVRQFCAEAEQTDDIAIMNITRK